METALLEPNTAETNDSAEATRPALSTSPASSISLPSEVSSQPMSTEVTENLLMETERGFQQEVKHHESGQNDLKHAAALVTNQRLQPVVGPALKRRQVAKPSLRSLVKATYAQRGQTWQSIAPQRQTEKTGNVGTDPAPVVRPQGKSFIEDVQHSPRVWAAQMARCGLEIIEGMRPLSQMTRWASPQAYRYLEQRRNAISSKQKPQPGLVGGKTRRVSPVRVLSAHSRATSATTHEAVVVLNDGQRTRAAALTLENHGDQWMIAAIRLG
ncbi:Rv3235 family protein [Mobiluncus sp.]|uniref:Rv3235 family protein n=1 Tax=Mobiluncus sp. TaxID=47293 RepID=UPI002A920043|nr:Rv3235 family protein [Mobiluncus sp.]MDY6076423.1 Rv3235 family protein [Mobiluncus sp.]